MDKARNSDPNAAINAKWQPRDDDEGGQGEEDEDLDVNIIDRCTYLSSFTRACAFSPFYGILLNERTSL